MLRPAYNPELCSICLNLSVQLCVGYYITQLCPAPPSFQPWCDCLLAVVSEHFV